MMKQLYKAYAFSFYFTYADKVRVICDAQKCC
mgnify:FL=1